MLSYEQYLQTTDDPFSDVPAILQSTDYTIVFPARAPYYDNHILIVPKRTHIFLLKDLYDHELIDIARCLHHWTHLLHQSYDSLTVLLRDAPKGSLSKSVGQLHWHIIPNFSVSAPQQTHNNRVFLDHESYLLCVQRIRDRLGLS